MDQTKSKRGGAGRGQGRKSLAPGIESVVVSVKMTPVQRAKLALLGGGRWIRDRIDKAHAPKEKANG